ncbi:unnamed protein product [Rangifer tarandus platyrhynchus]|uniref:Uncharacterized protein n=1 Tax=Rangifer tarandus platyrhynchus TaxID=3082113 RepID=A0ABN8YHS2_RANTA|nr:unnamed protein product [Rangifer tarandus platyrhynchus]
MPATKSMRPAPFLTKPPPPHPGCDRPPHQPAGHGTEPADLAQTWQTAPSEKQLNLCASAPSAVLLHPLRHGRPQAPRGDKHSASGTDSELCNQKSLQENPDFSMSFDVTLICGNVLNEMHTLLCSQHYPPHMACTEVPGPLLRLPEAGPGPGQVGSLARRGRLQTWGSAQRLPQGLAPNPLCTLGPEDQRPLLTTPATPKGPLLRSLFPEVFKGEASVCVCVCVNVNYECIAHVHVQVSGCVSGWCVSMYMKLGYECVCECAVDVEAGSEWVCI